MNLIDGYVKEVLEVSVKKSSEMWEIEDRVLDEDHYIYKVRAVDIGGEFITELWFDEPTEIKEGYKFLH